MHAAVYPRGCARSIASFISTCDGRPATWEALYDRDLRLDGAFLTRERGGFGVNAAASRAAVSLGAASGFDGAGASAQRPCTRRQRKLIRVMA